MHDAGDAGRSESDLMYVADALRNAIQSGSRLYALGAFRSEGRARPYLAVENDCKKVAPLAVAEALG